MERKSIYNLSLSAMLVAVGYILPLFTGQIPEIGNMLLPMHLPVFLAGLICGARYGLATGAILPLSRSLFFGMPVIFPNAVGMAVELAVYGLVAGLLYTRSRHRCIFSLYRALIVAMLLGRVAWGVTMVLILGLSGSAFTFSAFIAAALTNAIPGIAIQLVLIPAIMLLARRTHLVSPSKAAGKGDHRRENK